MTSVWERRAELQRDFLGASAELKILSGQDTELACSLLDGAVPDLAFPNAAFRRTLAQVVEGRLKAIRAHEDAHLVQVRALHAQGIERDQINCSLQEELNAVHRSKSWRVVNLYRRIRKVIRL